MKLSERSVYTIWLLDFSRRLTNVESDGATTVLGDLEEVHIRPGIADARKWNVCRSHWSGKPTGIFFLQGYIYGGDHTKQGEVFVMDCLQRFAAEMGVMGEPQRLCQRVEFGFGEERELEYSYSDEEEFVSEEEIDGILFLYGDARRIDPIFFEEDFENFDEEPKFESDGYDFVEDKLIFGEDGLVIEVVSLFEVPQELEEVVRDVDVNNDSLGLIAKAKVLKFATNDDVCVDGYLHDFSGQNNVLIYLFKHVETSCDDFIVKIEKTIEFEDEFSQPEENDAN
ncbi:hypothetical protein Sjap_025801 [Stephania japonica]|uniref:Uncharacterized protein n=1 Tax=Stephania japonica TaxID=461633 RepID=A0AAP0E2A7_9MAGN